MHTLADIKKEKSIDRLYAWLDKELEGPDRPDIVKALAHRIDKVEDLMVSAYILPGQVTEGCDA